MDSIAGKVHGKIQCERGKNYLRWINLVKSKIKLIFRRNQLRQERSNYKVFPFNGLNYLFFVFQRNL